MRAPIGVLIHEVKGDSILPNSLGCETRADHCRAGRPRLCGSSVDALKVSPHTYYTRASQNRTQKEIDMRGFSHFGSSACTSNLKSILPWVEEIIKLCSDHSPVVPAEIVEHTPNERRPEVRFHEFRFRP